MTQSKIDEDLIRRLATLLDETGLSELEIEKENLRVRVAKQISVQSIVGQAPAAAPAPANIVALPQAADVSSHPGAVKSPMVGTAYASAEPGKPPFIKIGDRVNKGQTLLIVEAMKVMNQIAAPAAGTVKEILFADAKPVEFGEVLLVIE